ncbi:helix-turn-helix domain-containing protein [Epilithonimonas sp. JDS]|uniref:helix-turn-helix domain-containing protein n=1 Tax=Epilithonimonas sp. JDS TaxID=2902797 RepID=UPI001E451504|nr:helix-turn-helix domain-containing protein [Epilithonimonas sp. JDS]MCD9856169.1 helix-turn-helix domain-containing protein [Epilithonimonas sp. JDS]
MLVRIFSLLLFLVLAVNVNAQINDAQNLTKDVKSLMYSDPEKAVKTAQYIVSNQSFGTAEDVYNALLLQSEIYFNLKKYNDAVVKLISADRISQNVDDDFLKSKNEYLIGKLYLELGFYDEYSEVLDDINEFAKSLKNEDEKICVESWVNELKILKLYHQGKQKESLAQIQTHINDKPNLDPVYNSRLQIVKSNIENKKSYNFQNSESYFQFLSGLIDLKFQIKNGTFNQLNVNNLKKKFPQFNDGVFFIDFYKDWSKQACGSNSSDCFGTRREYIKLLKSTLADKQEARVNVINLIDQKENAKIHEQKEFQNKILFLLFAVASLSLIISLIYYFIIKSKANVATVEFEKENISKEYEQRLSDQLKDFQASHVFTIPEKTENLILSNLETFEKSKDVRDPSLSLSVLAKRMNTNSKYLSEVINKHKGKNFNNYLNELRVNYIVEKLTQNPEYLQYKTSYLAEEAGFASRTTFTTIFKNVTGKSPSQFIDEIKNR